MTASRNPSRLGQAIAARRVELGLSQRAAADRAGINRATWATAETGERLPHPHNRYGIERTLRWMPGSIDVILSGGEPTIAEELPPHTPPVTPVEGDELVNEIERIKGLPISVAARKAAIRALIDMAAENNERAPGGDRRPA